MAESSEELRAPARESSPPTTHTAKTASTVPTFWIMVFGTRKIPLPMTVPTTIDAAAQGPRAPFNSVRCAFSMADLFLWESVTVRQRSLDERGEQAGYEGGDSPDEHVPGPGDRKSAAQGKS